MSGQDRRPIRTRSAGWAQALARRISQTSITPNGISRGSVVAAAFAALAFWGAFSVEGGAQIALLLLAALGIQLRLLCNMLDGMVAVEGGKGGPDGPFWNELPDRFGDALILAGAGYAVGEPALGWAATAGAMLTANVRLMGQALGQPADFGGPMAKPHRMFALTLAAVLGCLWNPGLLIEIALWVATLGALLTALLRSRRLLGALRG